MYSNVNRKRKTAFWMLFELAAVQNPQLTSYQERACQELFYVTVVIRGSSEEVYVLKCIVPEFSFQAPRKSCMSA